MGQTTNIEWTDATWNPWIGCRKVSEGCRHCYMFRDQERYGHDPSHIRRTADRTFLGPLRWREPQRIFTCSWSDFFLPEADPWRDDAWDIIRQTPHHTYQMLTKRPQFIRDRLPDDWGDGWPNVWLGVSAENHQAIGRVATLTRIPAVVRWVSAEPLLGGGLPTLYKYLDDIHWVVTGGESGPDARPMAAASALDIGVQCKKYGVPWFHKQNGGTYKIGGSWGGRVLGGHTWDGMPAYDGLTQRRLL